MLTGGDSREQMPVCIYRQIQMSVCIYVHVRLTFQAPFISNKGVILCTINMIGVEIVQIN